MRTTIIQIWEKQQHDLTTIIPKLDQYQTFLKQENEKMNLTAITNIDAVYEKHFYDSQLVMEYYNFQNKSVLDIGSGAGFPGIILKIFAPSINLTIIEANGKKINFIRQLIKMLDLQNVTLIQGRAEVESPKLEEQFDIVISRAVSKLPVLLEITAKFAKIDGKIIALKGSNAEVEVKQSENAFQKLNLKLIDQIATALPIEKSSRQLLIINKTSKTPLNYPRKYAQILKQPL